MFSVANLFSADFYVMLSLLLSLHRTSEHLNTSLPKYPFWVKSSVSLFSYPLPISLILSLLLPLPLLPIPYNCVTLFPIAFVKSSVACRKILCCLSVLECSCQNVLILFAR